jgi:hypothetical protein
MPPVSRFLIDESWRQQPTAPHPRVAVILASRNEAGRVTGCHAG